MPTTRLGSGDVARATELLGRFAERADPASFLADPGCVFLVATDEDQDVGWLYAYELARPDGRREMLLYALEVAGDHRGRGHGRALLAALVELARSGGHFELWTLTDPSNIGAVSLYRDTGGDASEQAMFTWSLE